MCTTCTPTQPADPTPEPIQMGKEYQTREGRPARVLAVGINHRRLSVAAVVVDTDGEHVLCYDSFGQWGNSPGRNDLVPVDPLAKFRNLPVDTPIWVRFSTGRYKPRHFKCIKDTHVFAFDDGLSSHTGATCTPWPVGNVSLTEPE